MWLQIEIFGTCYFVLETWNGFVCPPEVSALCDERGRVSTGVPWIGCTIRDTFQIPRVLPNLLR